MRYTEYLEVVRRGEGKSWKFDSNMHALTEVCLAFPHMLSVRDNVLFSEVRFLASHQTPSLEDQGYFCLAHAFQPT
jgi:hypothetical protein